MKPKKGRDEAGEQGGLGQGKGKGKMKPNKGRNQAMLLKLLS